MRNLSKVHTLRSLRALLRRVQWRGRLPMRGCGTKLALGCLLVVISAMVCGALIYRALGL